ncbi:MAG: HAMP domain-containing histidine kinase [Clostridia bacterium]|nr:HAMP domain-containing histidine kinase [Clostridia bacterium]
MDLRMMELAHDIRMPVQMICSCAQMLEMELSAEANAAMYLRMLVENARDLSSMVCSVLDGGADAEETLQRQSCDIIEEMRRVVRQYAQAAREKGVSFAFEASIRSFVMNTDAGKLRRIAGNLISNALAATPAGGRVELCVAVRGDGVDLIVKDTGCGIPPHAMPHIMQRGYTTGGYGMGLSIVGKYARMLGGCVYADSEEGKGSVFTVHLPVRNGKISI